MSQRASSTHRAVPEAVSPRPKPPAAPPVAESWFGPRWRLRLCS